MRSLKKLAAGAVACLALLAAPVSAQAIVRGSLDGTSHGNVGALTDTYNGAQMLACTGVLVSPTALVTAAHWAAQLQQLGFTQTEVSFDPNIGSGSDISCGLTDCVVSPTRTYLGTLHTDPQFNPSAQPSATTRNNSHDTAVVTFDTPVSDVTPASLPSAGQLDDMASNGTLSSSTFTAVGDGWHATNRGNSSTGVFDGQRRYATSGFTGLDQSDVHLSESASLGFGGACSHDSGGPAFIGNSSTVVGVVSGLDGSNCVGTYYDYRLDTPAARSFLANYVALP